MPASWSATAMPRSNTRTRTRRTGTTGTRTDTGLRGFVIFFSSVGGVRIGAEWQARVRPRDPVAGRQAGEWLRSGCRERPVADGRESGEVANSPPARNANAWGAWSYDGKASSPPVSGSGELAPNGPHPHQGRQQTHATADAGLPCRSPLL